MPPGRKAISAGAPSPPVNRAVRLPAPSKLEGVRGPWRVPRYEPRVRQVIEAALAGGSGRNPSLTAKVRITSAAALGHAGPVRAAARETGFADAAEGAARVHAALALAQQPALVQLSALIDVWRWGDRCGLRQGARARSPLSVCTLSPAAPSPLLQAGALTVGWGPHCAARALHPAHPHSVHERRRAGSHRDTRTRRRRAGARSGHSRSGTRPSPPLSCPLLRPPGECRHQPPPPPPAAGRRMARDPHLCVLPLHSPRGGFPSSRGLASQKELLSLCDVGHWDPGRDRGGRRRGCTQAPAPTPPAPRGAWLTRAAWRAGAALGSPTTALATAAVIEGKGWPGQGPRAHAIFSTLGPAHVPPLRGTLYGGRPGISWRPEGGRQSAPSSHPPSRGSRPRGSTQRTGPWNWPRTTLALTGWALRELAIAAGGPGHPGRAALAAVGARQVDAATRAAGCRVLALVYVYG